MDARLLAARMILSGFLASTTVGCVGWVAYRCPEVPASRSDPDRVAVDSLRKVRVVVRSVRQGESTEVLQTCLRKTGIFEAVDDDSTNRGARIAARIIESPPRRELLPILSGLTLGVLPQWFDDESGFVIRFTSLSNAPQMLEFDCRFESTWVFGWLSMLLTPLSAFATVLWWNAEETDEFAEYVGAKLLERAGDLAALANTENVK